MAAELRGPWPPLPEGVAEVLAGRLGIVRYALQHGAPAVNTTTSSTLAVRVADLDALQRRLEAALALLETP